MQGEICSCPFPSRAATYMSFLWKFISLMKLPISFPIRAIPFGILMGVGMEKNRNRGGESVDKGPILYVKTCIGVHLFLSSPPPLVISNGIALLIFKIWCMV